MFFLSYCFSVSIMPIHVVHSFVFICCFFPADVYSRCSFSLSTLAHAFCSDLDPGVFRVTPGKLLS